MKVKNTGSISLSGALSRNNSLKFLKVGDTVQVEVKEKIDLHSAVLNLKGNIVKAEFQCEIPQGKNLELLLEGKAHEKLLFRLLNLPSKESSYNIFFENSFFNEDEFSSNQLTMLNHYLYKEKINDIFSLTEILNFIKFKRNKERSQKLEKIIKKIVLNKLPYNQVAIINLLFSENPEVEISIYNLFLLFTNNHVEELNYQDIYDEFMNEKFDNISKNLSSDEIQEVLSLLINTKEETTGFLSGEIYVADEDTLKNVKYSLKENSVLLNFELVNLGKIEVLLLNEIDITVKIFCEKEQAIDEFEDKKNILVSNLKEKFNKNVSVNIIRLQGVLQKIIAINKSLKLSSGINIRV